jgi:acetylornithine/succinyldiaminopimelate/putrescine aminotransferase
LSCAAALAGLKELNNSGLIASVSQKEALFRKCLQHPKIKSISGRGLMLALEFDNFDQNLEIIQRCLTKGLLTDWFLFAPNKLRLAPPLIITESQIGSVCNILLECIY